MLKRGKAAAFFYISLAFSYNILSIRLCRIGNFELEIGKNMKKHLEVWIGNEAHIRPSGEIIE